MSYTHLIMYDAHKVRKYQSLYEGLMRLRAVRITECVWGVELDGGAGATREYISKLLDNDDTVVVIQLKPYLDWSTVNATPEATRWLSEHIKVYA